MNAAMERLRSQCGGHFVWILIGILYVCIIDAWNINLQPKQVVNAESLGWSFRVGTSDVDRGYFKLFQNDGRWLLIGGRNSIYNVSIDGLALQKSLDWSPTSQDIEICRMKGKSDEECQNYIRVLTKQGNGRILVCGTNAYKPMCRLYGLSEDNEYQMQREFSGFAISPYDPKHNSTALYVEATDELYSGTVSDFIGSDPLIYRKPLSGSGNELRTQRNNMKSLNDPNFVSIIDDEEAVYFFFRETALEHVNCGNAGTKTIFARIGRVCKNDQGGTRTYSDTWTSFLKARLNCSLPGAVPLYFDELQSTTTVTKIAQNNGMIYAVFTTPYNGLQASAVCAFRLADAKRILTQSAFKVQNNPATMWTAIDAPSPRPGSCESNSRSLPDDVLKFIQKNSLMDESVPNAFNEPVLVHSDLKSQLTEIAVHSNVIAATSATTYDIIFVGTDDGRVLKFVKANGKPDVQTILIETIQIFSDDRAVNNLLIHPGDADQDLDTGRLIVVSQDEVKSLHLHNCQNKTTCGSCVELQDPYCAWNVLTHKCVGRSNGYWSDGQYKQAVDTGHESDCPGAGNTENKVLFILNDVSAQPAISNSEPLIYGSEINMALAVIITLTIAATVGFFIGYRFSRWKNSNLSSEYTSSATSSASGTCYANAKLKQMNDARIIDVYGGSDDTTPVVPMPVSKSIRNEEEAAKLVMALSRDEKDILKRSKDEKDRFLNNDQGTLSKEYKVKKMYV